MAGYKSSEVPPLERSGTCHIPLRSDASIELVKWVSRV